MLSNRIWELLPLVAAFVPSQTATRLAGLIAVVMHWSERTVWLPGSGLSTVKITCNLCKWSVVSPEQVSVRVDTKHLLNQYSMSEHNGYFRVATTDHSSTMINDLAESCRKLSRCRRAWTKSSCTATMPKFGASIHHLLSRGSHR